MTPLGKQLVFWLKYSAEMDHLCAGPEDEGEEFDLTGLDDPERVRTMARTVGAAAEEQLADFLERCGDQIESHFTRLGATIVHKSKRSFVIRNWYSARHVQTRSAPGGWFSCAVGIWRPPGIGYSTESGVCGAVVLWLWSKGGRKGEDAVWAILGGGNAQGWPHSRGIDGAVEYIGTVALTCIPIKAKPPESFDVDSDPLIAKVTKALEPIGTKETKAIARFVAGLKQSDEG